MKLLLKEAFLIALAAAITWWFFLRPPDSETLIARNPIQEPLSVALTPILLPPPSEVAEPAPAPAEATPVEVPEEAPPDPEPAPEEEVEEENPAPPPPELGAPEGEGDVASDLDVEEPEPEDPPVEPETPEVTEAEPVEASAETVESRSAEELMDDEVLLSSAQQEVSGEAKRGFATVLLASPEEQLDIARYFQEMLVLVPRANLDPESERPTYFRIAADGARVETVAERAPLEGFRQYRDLFDYEYARLPNPLRELRRSVFVRNEIFLFAALIPVEEWAVIIGRRNEALALSGRELSDVRRFVLRYVQRSEGGFDLRVEEIVFADEERYRPPDAPHSRGT